MLLSYLDSYLSRKRHGLLDYSLAVGSLNNRIELRSLLYLLAIDIVFIAQTAHKSAAGAARLARIEREILFLCHLYRHLNKIGEERMAAERSAADAEAAHELSFVAYTYLTQLYTGPEHRSKILDKLAKIDSALRGKVKDELTVVKGIFNIDQLHLKPVLCYLFNAGIVCVDLLSEVFPMDLLVSLGSASQYRTQRQDHLAL